MVQRRLARPIRERRKEMILRFLPIFLVKILRKPGTPM